MSAYVSGHLSFILKKILKLIIYLLTAWYVQNNGFQRETENQKYVLWFALRQSLDTMYYFYRLLNPYSVSVYPIPIEMIAKGR